MSSSLTPPTDSTWSRLFWIRDHIERMPKVRQVEVLRLLLNSPQAACLNENQYGTHVNLTQLSPETTQELCTYVQFVLGQESFVKEDEQKKESFRTHFF
jgi:hypothetical protein